MNRLKLLNLGCGSHFHPDWDNVDFVSAGPSVKTYNLLNGIPYPDNSYDVVYHSHVLEHFPKSKAKEFICECYRVLKTGGVLRVAVPDLEKIASEYLKQLNDAVSGVGNAKENYDWIMLELYDQVVRNKSGGRMAAFIFNMDIKNPDYVYSRIGIEWKKIREEYFNSVSEEKQHDKQNVSSGRNLIRFFKPSTYFNFLKRKFFKKELKYFNRQNELLKMANFRLSGEVHQWMYDRFSLKELLNECGFKNIEVKTAFESRIEGWNNFCLDVVDGMIRKPDSLFIEAEK